MSIKSGIQTSEFWATSLLSLISLLGAAGIVGPNDMAPLSENVKTVVLGLFSLLSILAYIRGRFELKKAVLP